MAAEIALNDRTPAIHRSFSIRGKKPFGPCDSNASTSAFNNGRIPLPGFVILVAADAQHKITLYGTPADRAGLCVGDEIIEVNGTPVEGKEHAEIVRLIHKITQSSAFVFILLGAILFSERRKALLIK
ncbi:unnamed protein product [Toxocara canis]|uniref:PDZ domain-containing protein n=1 Tax=Toxocara canis TaxID=6265 RepID=A0A183VEL2_TOXCA|nr:unnamed protein product [Toxocara canis]